MKVTLLPLLINPYTANSLKMENDTLVDEITGEKYYIKNNIPVLYREDEVKGLNRLYQKRYDWNDSIVAKSLRPVPLKLDLEANFIKFRSKYSYW